MIARTWREKIGTHRSTPSAPLRKGWAPPSVCSRGTRRFRSSTSSLRWSSSSCRRIGPRRGSFLLLLKASRGDGTDTREMWWGGRVVSTVSFFERDVRVVHHYQHKCRSIFGGMKVNTHVFIHQPRCWRQIDVEASAVPRSTSYSAIPHIGAAICWYGRHQFPLRISILLPRTKPDLHIPPPEYYDRRKRSFYNYYYDTTGHHLLIWYSIYLLQV